MTDWKVRCKNQKIFNFNPNDIIEEKQASYFLEIKILVTENGIVHVKLGKRGIFKLISKCLR